MKEVVKEVRRLLGGLMRCSAHLYEDHERHPHVVRVERLRTATLLLRTSKKVAELLLIAKDGGPPASAPASDPAPVHSLTPSP